MRLSNGLYDLILTERLERALAKLDPGDVEVTAVREDTAARLVDTLGRQLAAILADLPDDEGDKLTRQLRLVNELLVMLRQRLAPSDDTELVSDADERVDLLASPLRVLESIDREKRLRVRPALGLAAPWLFTAGKGTPSLLHEIRRELLTADQVDILVSFITVSGVRKLRDVLHEVTSTDARGRSATRLRILTTTYTGATEARALDELAGLPGCEVRVSLDGRRTRLHAKAWLFHRKSGFGSAYVGSANLSGAALTGGLEWTVKLTQRAQEALFSRACAHFESLWADSEFQQYDPEIPAHRSALAAALRKESGEVDSVSALRFFELQPKTYQIEMLEQLAAERAQGRMRNLLVAATGTGKTVVAAFDYLSTCRAEGGRPRLLFVAHREEILRQALRTYREVLRDPEFGELLTGRNLPERWDHLFATIDSVSTQGLVERFGPEHWYSVVIDECHRLAASRFDALATSIKPRVLLGLTATPERSDGQSILSYFDSKPDGSPAVELRLWHALDLQLLAPFEYYACDDATDFSSVPWDQPGEREALDRLLTGNDIRARLVVNEWRRLASDARRSRALVFCVSVAHAEFMTGWLNREGLPAACVVGESSPQERREAPQRLMRGELCALVTVDLYNEGVDLPMVDTLLLLRPTQSPVVFQQQIGRGLRLSPGKESCLVLDFVGQHRADFRMDRLLSSLTGLSRRELEDSLQNGFGSLPAGCHLHLQRQTREQVLLGLRALTQQSWPRLRTELGAYAALRGRSAIRLASFLHDQSLTLEEIYRSGTGTAASGWTTLKRDVGLIASEPGPEEIALSKRFANLLHVDDPMRLDHLHKLGSTPGSWEPTSPRSAQCIQMLAYQIDHDRSQTGDHRAFSHRLAQHPHNAEELLELAALLRARTALSYIPITGLEDTPLCLHAAYGIREILTAVGWLTPTRRTPFQAGVLSLNGKHPAKSS